MTVHELFNFLIRTANIGQDSSLKFALGVFANQVEVPIFGPTAPNGIRYCANIYWTPPPGAAHPRPTLPFHLLRKGVTAVAVPADVAKSQYVPVAQLIEEA